MKKLILCAALLSANAFGALNVHGDAATALRSALRGAGAEAQVMADANSIKVSGLKCSQVSGVVLGIMNCSFVDENNGRLVEAKGIKGDAIAMALDEAHVKGQLIRRGEYTKVSYSVKEIQCLSTVMPKAFYCSVTVK